MAHVLFNGDIQRHPALRSLLWQWGVTVGRLPQGDPAGFQATVEDCDAVLHLQKDSGHAENGFSAMPDGADAGGAAAAAAPLLVVGSESDSLAVNPWITIPDFGPGGSRLKVAVQSCVKRARVLRGEVGSQHDESRFRDFVGHELRSPLTAVKTALTVLGDEKDPAPGSARMLSLALRNLNRLADAVEWSQELMWLAEEAPAADLVPQPASAMVGTIPDHLEVRLDQNSASCEILTDLRLLGILTRQMERVFTFLCPANRPVFRLETDPVSGDCRLSVLVSGIGEETRLDRAEFENLTRMLISPHLLQVLGVKPRLGTGPRDHAELSIVLPLWSAVAPPAPEPLLAV
ncbi:MAG: hypothetical protein ABFS42_03090 [Candidatus Krumholzibacteriota bacterium]